MTEYSFTLISGEEIPVIIDSRRGLRNVTLRPKTAPRREIHMSKPLAVPVKSALDFLVSKSDWVNKIFERAPVKVKIKDGDVLYIFGRAVQIKQDSNMKSNCYHNIDNCDGTGVQIVQLVIGGTPDMLERRIRDFIKKEFLGEVRKIIKTTPVEFWPDKISVRDTISRWGSRSSTGVISFSWRLAFAPHEVLRYVVMHELAHTKHMNHSVDFWATVSRLYGDGAGRAKLWLSRNGARLHKYL
jgi:predicted metal-dependent hydrolase